MFLTQICCQFVAERFVLFNQCIHNQLNMFVYSIIKEENKAVFSKENQT